MRKGRSGEPLRPHRVASTSAGPCEARVRGSGCIETNTTKYFYWGWLRSALSIDNIIDNTCHVSHHACHWTLHQSPQPRTTAAMPNITALACPTSNLPTAYTAHSRVSLSCMHFGPLCVLSPCIAGSSPNNTPHHTRALAFTPDRAHCIVTESSAQCSRRPSQSGRRRTSR